MDRLRSSLMIFPTTRSSLFVKYLDIFMKILDCSKY